MTNSNYFNLYSNCLFVKGIKRSVVCDLQRNLFKFIPNSLFELFSNTNSILLRDLYKDILFDDQDVLDQYFDFLVKNDFGFFSHIDHSMTFPKYSLAWDYPAEISNSILDIGIANLDFKNIFEQLVSFHCKDFQLRFFRETSVIELVTILDLLNDSIVKSVELIIPWTESFEINEVRKVVNEYNRIKTCYFYNAPKELINIISNSMSGHILFSSDRSISVKNCGLISNEYFSLSIENFTEAQKHNTCLNRKISIDVNGEIKNCPSMSKSYGNIKDTTLLEAIEKPGFKDVWFINKDQIAVCKDCEFRYICTDCRAYIENPEDIYSKPLKCGYNPYTAEWEEWSTNPLKQKAIEYYGIPLSD